MVIVHSYVSLPEGKHIQFAKSSWQPKSQKNNSSPHQIACSGALHPTKSYAHSIFADVVNPILKKKTTLWDDS